MPISKKQLEKPVTQKQAVHIMIAICKSFIKEYKTPEKRKTNPAIVKHINQIRSILIQLEKFYRDL